MSVIRALIIGSDDAYCKVIKEFLELKGVISAIILDYKKGIDKLTYEKPDFAVIEQLNTVISPSYVSLINDIDQFEIIYTDRPHDTVFNFIPVFLLDNSDNLNKLFELVKTYISNPIEKDKNLISESSDEGDLESNSYFKILLDISKKKKTGILNIDSRNKLTIYFLNGSPVFAEGGDLETAIGKILINHNKISESDLEKAKEIAELNKQRIGEALIGIGAISHHELIEFLKIQVEEKIIRGFFNTQGKYYFNQEDEFTNELASYQINLFELIYRCTKNYIDLNLIDDLNLKIEFNPKFKNEIDYLGFGPKELRFIQLLKKDITIKEILENSTLDKDNTLSLLYYLDLIELIKIDNLHSAKMASLSANKTMIQNEKVQPSETEGAIDLDQEIELPDNSADGDSFSNDSQDAEDLQISTDIQQSQVLNLKVSEPLELELDKTSKIKEPSGEPSSSIELEMESPGGIDLNTENQHENIHPIGNQDEVKLNDSYADLAQFYSNLRNKNYYDILGIERDSNEQEIKDSYFILVRKYHPDSFPNTDKNTINMAEEIFTKITLSYQTLSDPTKRNNYDSAEELAGIKDKAHNIYEAEFAFKEGHILLNQRRYTEAEKKFKDALELNPDEPVYLGAHAWSIFLSSDEKDNKINDLIEKLNTSIRLNNSIAENYYYLGTIYKYINDIKSAEINFKEAISKNPEYIEAKRELRLIQHRKISTQNKPSSKKIEKRFWSSLFKK